MTPEESLQQKAELESLLRSLDGSANGDQKNSLIISDDFLSAAKQGRLNGIEIPLGTSKQDLLNILGEPDETGKIHIHTPYLKYAKNFLPL